jgi:hypothetical protein
MRNTITTLTVEKEQLTQFVLSRLVPHVDKKGTPVSDIFKAYKRWRKNKFMPRTRLSVDGFGQVFPKTYKRRVAWVKGKATRVVMGVKVL